MSADNGGMAGNGGDSKKPAKSGGRSQRLAAALRENLRRRKAQERARAPSPGSRPAPVPHGDKDR
jgi:hypothetical protein